MSKAIVVHEPGGPEVLCWEEWDVMEPGPDEVLIKQLAVGVNFIDTYLRSGAYPAADYPFVPGIEACGLVIRAGANVSDSVSIGDRVAYGISAPGAYARFRTMDANYLTRVPDEISDAQAAAVLTKGLTAHYLVTHTYFVKDQSRVLVYAAAGGTGLFITQWARYRGAQVIGLVGADEKMALAEANGCNHVINYRKDNVVEAVRELTNGQGVNVVYDSVGRDTLMQSLDCLAPLGLLVSFGQSSGVPEPVDLEMLRDKGSLFVTRPSLFDYKRDVTLYHAGIAELFDMVLHRHLKINVMQTYNIEDAAQAHADLEAGNTVGSSVLLFK